MRKCVLCVASVVALFFAASDASAGMISFNFSGLPIENSGDPLFQPDVTATFDIMATELLVTLTYNLTTAATRTSSCWIISSPRCFGISKDFPER